MFADEHRFGYRLLSDVDQQVGAAYETQRPPDDQYPTYPLRISYLIDPDGTIARSYTVTDTDGHAAEVLADLRLLVGGN